MKPEEIVLALRACADMPDCAKCPAAVDKDNTFCVDTILKEARTLIERLMADNAELLQGLRYWSGCNTCAHSGSCTFIPAVEDCNHCRKSGACICETCKGAATEHDKWEWNRKTAEMKGEHYEPET